MAFEPVDELTVGPATWVRWHEAIEGVVELRSISVSGAAERLLPLHIPAGEDVELLIDDGGRVVGRLVRTRFALEGLLRVRFHPAGPAGLVAVSVALENRTEPVAAAGEQVGPDKPRDVAARFSFVGAHLLLAARGAIFLSMTDPPDFAIEATADCRNHRCWPVLVGEQGSHDTVLASPIILSDYPEIADESPGDLYDSTEIDEILTLRIMTMTDEEKRAARGTDPRAAAIIDRSDNLPPEIFERLHGALRGLNLKTPDVMGLLGVAALSLIAHDWARRQLLIAAAIAAAALALFIIRVGFESLNVPPQWERDQIVARADADESMLNAEHALGAPAGTAIVDNSMLDQAICAVEGHDLITPAVIGTTERQCTTGDDKITSNSSWVEAKHELDVQLAVYRANVTGTAADEAALKAVLDQQPQVDEDISILAAIEKGPDALLALGISCHGARARSGAARGGSCSARRCLACSGTGSRSMPGSSRARSTCSR